MEDCEAEDSVYRPRGGWGADRQRERRPRLGPDLRALNRFCGRGVRNCYRKRGFQALLVPKDLREKEQKDPRVLS